MRLLFALLGCAAPPPVETAHPETGHPETGPVETGLSETGEAAAPVFANPPEAEDLDPDPAVVHVRLSAAPATHTFLLPDAEGGAVEVAGYAYNGGLPGPTIRARVGDTVIVEVENGLDEPTTVHWHGLEVPFAVDGVPWMMEPAAPN